MMTPKKKFTLSLFFHLNNLPVFLLIVIGIELIIKCILVTCSTTERHPHLSFYFDARLPRLTLNLWSPWLRLPRGCNYKPTPLGLAIRHHFNFPFTLQLVYLHLGTYFFVVDIKLVKTYSCLKMKSHVLEKYSLSEKDIGSCCRFPGRHSQVVALFSYMTKCGLGIPIFAEAF